MKTPTKPLRAVASVVMGTSPKGHFYNNAGEGLPLLNGPTEFGESHPLVSLFTTKSVRECEPGDLIFCVRGSTTGRMNWADRVYSLGRGVCAIRGASQLDTKFIRYCLETRLPALLQLAGGTTFPNLPADTIKDFHIPHPKNREYIASILSAYDDLIENNRRRMGLLEEAARQLYREWFVRLRFPGSAKATPGKPGHEHVKIKDGLPEGWDIHTLDRLCVIGRGASPRPIAAFMDGDVPWFKIGDATASESPFIFHTAEHVTDEGAKKSILLDPDSLILSNSATCGIPYFTAVRGCIHDGWLHFSHFKRLSPQFLYCFLHHKREELVSSVGDGSTQKNLNTSAVGRLKLVLPQTDSLLSQFDDCTVSLFSLIRNLAVQNEKLRAARDLLLPKLMSGEIAV